MSVLRVAALWALPLVLLPILIHLVYRRRHPSMDWGAMMFVRTAMHSGRGPAKWRRRIILALRTFVVLAAVLALARPLSSGLLGIAANRLGSGATTIVILDRSPSMQRRLLDGRTRQVAALQSVVQTLETVGTQSIVVFDSVHGAPVTLEQPDQLLTPPFMRPADASARLPLLMNDALDFVRDNERRVADLWVCSDRQSGDWDPESLEWQRVRDALRDAGEGCRLYLTEFSADEQVNESVVVSQSRWIDSASGSYVELAVQVMSEDNESKTIPVAIRSGGTTQSVELELTQGRGELSGILVDVGDQSNRLLGVVSIPADVNAADDQWYFVAEGHRGRPMTLVTEESCLALQVIADVVGKRLDVERDAEGASDSNTGQGRGASNLNRLLDQSACIIWQGPLPTEQAAGEVRRFIEAGGSALFFPPNETSSETSFLNVRWGEWFEDGPYKSAMDDWEFEVERYCAIEGDLVTVARVAGAERFCGKMRLGNGTALFCGADVIDSDSLFVNDGLTLYRILSEALDASDRFDQRQSGWTACRPDEVESLYGVPASSVSRRLPEGVGSDGDLEFGAHAGVYSVDDRASDSGNSDESPLYVFNRDPAESTSPPVDDEFLDGISPWGDWNRVTVRSDAVESESGFVREAWSAIWTMMIVAMLAEAWLSLPRRISGAAR